MKANMVYYQIYLFQSNTFVYHCVINQTLQNGQTLGQFLEQLYQDTNKENIPDIRGGRLVAIRIFPIVNIMIDVFDSATNKFSLVNTFKIFNHGLLKI
jgi:hypothetical protein